MELLKALAELGRVHPEWRLGQTLSNLAMAAGRLDAGGVWDLEDEEGLAAARFLLDQRVATTTGFELPARVRVGTARRTCYLVSGSADHVRRVGCSTGDAEGWSIRTARGRGAAVGSGPALFLGESPMDSPCVRAVPFESGVIEWSAFA